MWHLKMKLFTMLAMMLPAGILSGQQAVPANVMQQVYEEIKAPYKYGLVLVPEDHSKMVDSPSVFRENNKWYMTYIVFDGKGYETCFRPLCLFLRSAELDKMGRRRPGKPFRAL
jgi:hypothetical protein